MRKTKGNKGTEVRKERSRESGSREDKRVRTDAAGSVALELRAPASNETYARVSGDYNPIHVSRVFSSYANLPGTITHGMYSSAAVRSFVETWAERGDPRVSTHTGIVDRIQILEYSTRLTQNPGGGRESATQRRTSDYNIKKEVHPDQLLSRFTRSDT